jgi:hypothetical protein
MCGCGCSCGSEDDEKEVAKEAAMIPCKYCKTLFAQSASFFPTVAQEGQRNLRDRKHSTVLEISKMLNRKSLLPFIFATVLLSSLTLPVFAVDYNPGVTVGQNVKYGNFIGIGQGFEAFNDFSFLQLQVTGVSGEEVTLLSTGQFKNGTALPGNGATSVWNLVLGTEDGAPSTLGPIIAANLNKGDSIPPPNTYTVNQSESRTYLGYSRTVNIINVEISTSDYNSTLTYVYDKLSGMLLESSVQTITQSEPQPVTSSYSYSVIETNIFNSSTTPLNPPTQYIIFAVVLLFVVIAIAIIFLRKRRAKQSSLP